MAVTKINILLACEYPIICLGIAKLIGEHHDLSVFGGTSSLADLYAILKKSHIDVALIELPLLKASGLAAIKDILKIDPGIKLIVLSRNEKEPFISKSIDYGALGYVSLKCKPEELVEAIRSVHANEKYLSRDVAYDFAIASLSKENQLLSTLTNREYQVFALLSQGVSVNEISESIFISPKTVHVYRANIMQKLSAKNLAELTLVALKNGIISLDVIK